jgi:CubicO group peptidase (beta-lactamase class C family)
MEARLALSINRGHQAAAAVGRRSKEYDMQIQIRTVTLIFALLCVFGWARTDARAAAQTPDYWPTEGWRHSSPEAQGVESKLLAEMIQKILEEEHNIDNITIIRNGYIVLDVYFHPFQRDLKHIIHSCTKSITSSLVGIAIDQGIISGVETPVIEFFPDKTFAHLDDDKRAMTLEHLLMMATGLHCRDSYLYGWEGLDEMHRSRDWIQFVLDLPMRESPGSRFEYCNGASYLLSAILHVTTKTTTLAFANEHLFGPLGISGVEWPVSRQFINIGWGGIWMTPHDMAKFGFLYLNGGVWDGEQIVSSRWVEASTSSQIDAGTMAESYGYQWWVDIGDYYMALGYGGQLVIVNPEHNSVTVFTSVLANRFFFTAEQLYLDFVIPAVTSTDPLPENSSAAGRLDSLVQVSSQPLPRPVQPAPAIARRISAKTFVFDANEIQFKKGSITFTDGEDEAQFELSFGYRNIKTQVGLDDVYRLTRSSGFLRAYKGSWENDSTFAMSYQVVGRTEKGTTRLIFGPDRVKATFFDVMEGIPHELIGHYQD